MISLFKININDVSIAYWYMLNGKKYLFVILCVCMCVCEPISLCVCVHVCVNQVLGVCVCMYLMF